MAARDFVSRVVSHPRVFDAQTTLLGARRLERVMRPLALGVTRGRPRGTVVDVGGGTASAHAWWPEQWTYVSVDPDRRVVRHDRVSDRIHRVVGDASRLAFADRSVDVVLMKGVAHHLDDSTWPRALSEANRILKPEARLVFVDGLWSSRRWISRLGWMVDAGRHPRGSARLFEDLARWFEVEATERLTLLHDCLVVTARPIPPATRLRDVEMTGGSLPASSEP
jgi:SAM-dependent methyltransferase